MFIKELEIISFGNIKNKKITFSDGINIICGDNETGKSTILSFIRFMFYGTGTKKSDIRKYEPLSGEKMNGLMVFETNEGVFEISRNLNLTRSKQVRCVNKTLGKDFDAEFCKNLGQNLLNMNEETFVNTHFIGQLSSKLSGSNDEILQKLSNLSQSGNEDISYNQISAKVDEMIASLSSERRKSAVIPSLERKLDEETVILKKISDKKLLKEDVLKQTEREKNELEIINNEIKILKEKETALKALETRKRLADEKNNIVRLKKSIESDEVLFNKIIPDERFSKIDEEKQKEALADKESDFEKKENLLKESKKRILIKLCTVSAVLFLISVSLCFLSIWSLFGILPAAVAAVFAVFKNKKISGQIVLIQNEKEEYKKSKDEYFSHFGAKNKEEYLSAKAKYESDVKEKDVLSKKIQSDTKNLEILLNMYENTKKDALTNCKNIDTIKVADYDASVNVSEILEKTNELLNIAKKKEEKIHELIFTAKSLGGDDEISVRENICALKEELNEANEKLCMIKKAKDYIDGAFSYLKSNFAPALAKKTSEILEKITLGKHNEAIVDEKFLPYVKIGGAFENGVFLSGGALEQMYFSLRMGIISIIDGGEKLPVILDDAFAYYDDKRLFEVLKYIEGISENMQIIIASCHDREKNYFKDVSVKLNKL